MQDNVFKGRKLVIATMHEKERVIAPILEKELGVKVVVPEGFDTNAFGTFTKEIDRAGNQLEAARKKLLAAMDITGADLGVSSEGSFHPHPSIPMVPSNFELLLFIDKKNDYEIRGHYRTTKTNIDGTYVSTVDEARKFAEHIGFPEHGVIVRKKKDQSGWMEKTIETTEDLTRIVKQRLARPFTNRVYIQTDMRANKNPTRMLAIEQAAHDLVKNIKSLCSECSAHGFVCVDLEKGLKCSLCNASTDLPVNEIYTCAKCDYTEKKPVLTYGSSADPKFCDYCNP